MIESQIILDHITCDKHNIQELINLLPHCTTKREYISIGANIRILVKEIKAQKTLLREKFSEKLAPNEIKHLQLFDVEPSEVIIDYSNITSFFDNID